MPASVKCRYRDLYVEQFGWTPDVFTYIIECQCETANLLKFGKSNTPTWRLTMLQTGCPFPLKIQWCWPEDIEQNLHNHFASRLFQGEWYQVPLNEAIAAAAYFSKEKCVRETGIGTNRYRLPVKH